MRNDIFKLLRYDIIGPEPTSSDKKKNEIINESPLLQYIKYFRTTMQYR